MAVALLLAEREGLPAFVYRHRLSQMHMVGTDPHALREYPAEMVCTADPRDLEYARYEIADCLRGKPARDGAP